VVDFVKAAATAKRLVEAAGRPVDLFRVNRTPDDPAQPWRGVSGSPTVPEGGRIIPVIVAFVPASGSGFGKLVTDSGGTLNVAFDQVGLLATDTLPTGVTPTDVEQMDSMRDGDDIWKIVARGHLRPGTRSVLFLLALKR
jgi:hypothetical protein